MHKDARAGMSMPTLLYPNAVREGYMVRSTHFLTTMKQPEEKWRVDKMVKATEEAVEKTGRLEGESCTSGREFGSSLLADFST